MRTETYTQDHPMPLEDEIDLASLAALLRRQARLIAGIMLLTLALPLAYLALVPPTYTAQALILFDPAQKNLLEVDQDTTSAQSDNARIESEVEILRAPATALGVIERAGLMRDPEFGPSPEDGSAALKSVVTHLMSATEIQRRGLTYLIAVQVSSQRPDQAAHLTNTMAEVYIEAQVDAKIAASLGARDALQARIEAGRAAVTQADAAIARFIQTHQGALGADAASPDLHSLMLQADLPPESLAQVFGLEQEAAIARTQYHTLLSRLRDLEAQARLQVADSRIVSAAMVPNTPSAPDTRLILLLGLIAGLGLGVGLAFFRDYYAGGITSAAQLRDLVQAPVATSVPLVIGPPNEATSCADKIVSEPLSPYTEAIRRLRVSLDHGFRHRSAPAGEGRVVMITSAGPNEGKTALALALARLYAISGKKTLLIDGDLRKPGVHVQAGVQPQFGLLEYLRDPSQTEVATGFYTRDPQTPLSLVLGAGRSGVPTDQLIGSPTFEMILRDVRRSFDRVIIDTSPLMPVVDARMIVYHADAVVMAARYANTARADLRGAVQVLAEAIGPDTDVYTVLSHQDARAKNDGYTSVAARA